MITRKSLYLVSTGELTGTVLTGTAEFIAANTPDGVAAISGQHDAASARVVDGGVVEWQPPQPDENHEWSVARRRWILTPVARKALNDHDAALRALQTLDVKRSRALADHLLQPDQSTLRRLAEIESEADRHRINVLKAPPREYVHVPPHAQRGATDHSIDARNELAAVDTVVAPFVPE